MGKTQDKVAPSRHDSIWVVEDGAYSDYHVVGLYSTKANAEMAAAKFGGEVAEWPIDPSIEELRQGLTQWIVHMLRDGTTERCWESEYLNSVATFSLWERTKAPAYAGKNVPDCLVATVWAKTKEQAIKRANEIRTQMIATGKWK